jgi:hypothetical protein
VNILIYLVLVTLVTMTLRMANAMVVANSMVHFKLSDAPDTPKNCGVNLVTGATPQQHPLVYHIN